MNNKKKNKNRTLQQNYKYPRFFTIHKKNRKQYKYDPIMWLRLDSPESFAAAVDRTGEDQGKYWTKKKIEHGIKTGVFKEILIEELALIVKKKSSTL